MRFVLLVTLASLAACSHPPSGPAWPKTTDREIDGGESIAPHVARSNGAGSTASATPDDAADDDKPAAAATKDADKPAAPVVTPSTSTFDDSLFDGDFSMDVDD